MTGDIFSLLKNKILVLDGAMGTLIQSHKLKEADYRGDRFASHNKVLSGCNDVLNMTQPNIISEIHAKYLDAGADIIETNTFNANAVSLADYKLENYVYEINFQAAQIARKLADSFTVSNPLKPRFVAGSVGPTSKSLSISPDINRPEYRNITYDALMDAYLSQIKALIEGGADIILIETVFDTLNAKAALHAACKAFESTGKELPVIISATITDNAGRNLSGQTLEAFLCTFEHYPLLAIGLNCAFGANEMYPYVKELSASAPFNLCIYPNAGLPDESGKYNETPQEMAVLVENFCRQNLINILGGCCGTTPEHIKLFAGFSDKYNPRIPAARSNDLKLCGLECINIHSGINFVNIGERTNVTGSKKFAELIENHDFKTAAEVARNQVVSGAQIIDICMDAPLLDARQTMVTFLNYIASEPDIARVPFMIDSSDWNVITDALKNIQGKPVVNSLSLKEGETAFIEKARLLKQFGAAVVIMCFDEKGQADTFERKIEIAQRAYHLLTAKAHILPQNIIIDPNVLAICTGTNESRFYAHDFIKAVAWIRENLPLASISGGLSNLSFAFRGKDNIRAAIHAVFLYHAIKAGMNMGIVNPAQLVLYDDIPVTLKNIIEDVIFNTKENAVDVLINYINTGEFSLKSLTQTEEWVEWPAVDRLRHALIHGMDKYIVEDTLILAAALKNPVELIEKNMMEAMNTVGTLFGEGKMFLPQVVKSAKVMKTAVDALMPLINKRNEGTDLGDKIIMATVKGDVHDIGKNIVSIVLSCNNVTVIDLGVMVPAEKIIEEALHNNAVAIALSGLITPSLHEMIHVAEELEKRNSKIPLLIGGAATSKKFTALKMYPVYSGPVIYVKDASMASAIVSKLLSAGKDKFLQDNKNENEAIFRETNATISSLSSININEARSLASLKKDVTNKPLYALWNGLKVYDNFPEEEIISLFNWNAFFNAWKIKGKFPEILNDINKGNEARKLYYEADKELNFIRKNKLLKFEALVAVYKAVVDGDDIIVHTDEGKTTLFMLRNQAKDTPDTGCCLSDFVASDANTGSIGLFMVSAAIDNNEQPSGNNDFIKIIRAFLADGMAEAMSQWLFEKTLQDIWHINKNDMKGMQAIKPAVGYPCYPDHSEKQTIFNILQAEKLTHVKLTENFAMTPVSSICGLYLIHPNARYFSVSKVFPDQLNDYAKRKNKDKEYLEKMLSTNII